MTQSKEVKVKKAPVSQPLVFQLRELVRQMPIGENYLGFSQSSCAGEDELYYGRL